MTASELATFVYCRRAWWLRHVCGHAPGRRDVLLRGRVAHGRHARQVSTAQWAVRAGVLLAGIGVVLLAWGLFVG